MIYRVRLNPKAYNPLTKKIAEGKVWEVEQMKTKDSDGVKWHCHDVQIGTRGRVVPIRELFVFAKPGEKQTEMEFEGYVLRGYDGSICIQEVLRGLGKY